MGNDSFTLLTALVCLKVMTIVIASSTVIDKQVHISLFVEHLSNQHTSEIHSPEPLPGDELLANPIAVVFQVGALEGLSSSRTYQKSAVPLFVRSLFNDINYALERDQDPSSAYLSHLEFSMCGGRWRREWGSTSGDAASILYPLTHHVPCSSASISMCFSTNSSKGGNFTYLQKRRIPESLHRAHDTITKHLGAVLGTTSGLAEVPSGLRTANNVDIPFHIRPIQTQGGSDTKQCYIDEILMEKLCTQNIHPIKEIFISPLIKCYVEENQRADHHKYQDTLLHHIIPSFPLLLATPFHSISLKLALTKEPIKVEVAYVITTKYELEELTRHFRELLAKYSGDEALRDIVRGSAAETILHIMDLPKKQLLPNIEVPDHRELGNGDDRPSCTVRGHLQQRGEVRGTFYIKLECEILPQYSKTSTAFVLDTLIVIPTRTIIPLLKTMRKSDECNFFEGKKTKCEIKYGLTTSTTLSLVNQYNERGGRDDMDLLFQMRNIIQTDKDIPIEDSGKVYYNISFDFNYPSLPNAAYPPDMHKGYIIPPLVTRVAQVIPLGISQCTDCEPIIGKEEISHQQALSTLLLPIPSILDNKRLVVKHISFQRSVASSTVTSLPIPDPAMIFNVVSLSSAIFSICIGGIFGVVMRRRF